MKLFGGKGHKTTKRGSSTPSSTKQSSTKSSSTKSSSVTPATPTQGKEPSLQGGQVPPRRRRTTKKSGFQFSKILKNLNGTQRGLILLGVSLAVLGTVVYAATQMLVQPPDRTTTTASTTVVTTVDDDGNEVTQTVTSSSAVAMLDPDTGEEIEIEFEAPGSNKDGYYNILVVGTDDDGTRTDTIMIARMDANEQTVALMSIPRDTLINTTASTPKINSVYGNNGKGDEGIAALEKHLKSILGFEVDGYVMVDLDAFVQVVNLVGGVEFDVPVNMYYNDPTQDLYINIAAGYQLLDGQTALEMVRYRSGYAGADITRTGVQQDFVKALALECLEIGNLTKISQFAEIFVECVDTDMTVGNLIYFASELMNCDFENMYTVTLPGQSVMVNGVSCYSLYPSQVLEIVNEYFNPYDTDISAGNLFIRTASYSTSSSSTTTTTTSTSSDYSDDDSGALLDVGDEEIDEDLLDTEDTTESSTDESTDSSDTSADTTTDSATDTTTDTTTDSATTDTTTDTTTDSATESVVETALLIT